MEISISPAEMISIVAGAIVLLLALIGALTWAARSNSKNSQATVNIFDTLVQLNKELVAASEERLKHAVERERWEHERSTLARRVNEQGEVIELNKKIAKDADEQHTRALGAMQKELHSAMECQRTLEVRIDDLTEQIRQKDARIAALEARIGELEKENRDLKGERTLLIQQIAELKTERDEQKRQIEELRAKLELLERRDTGALSSEPAESTEPAVSQASEEPAAEAADNNAQQGETS